jgi:hypothetical protein
MTSLRTRVLAAFIAMVGCAGAPPPPPPPPAPEVTIDVFEDALAAHGEWIVVAPHGRVWRPIHVAAGWQPYLYGEWVWTDDGWFWLTDEPWGWATYHYGRWGWDRALGWFWVPGFVWAPAWVAWRVGDGFVGWAPLYPGFTVWWTDPYPLVATHWIFVPMSSFVAVRIEIVAMPRARVPALVRSCRPAPPPNVRRPSPAPRLGGPPRQLVEEHVRRPITPARVVAVPAPVETRRRTDLGAVPVYRPAPRPRDAAPAPERAPAAPAPRPAEAAPAPERAPAAAPATGAKAAPAAKRPARKTEDEGKRSAPARPTSPRGTAPDGRDGDERR